MSAQRRLALPEVIDLDVIASLMRKLEAGIHREGWAENGANMQIFAFHNAALTGEAYQRLFRSVVRDGDYCVSRMLSNRVFEMPGKQPYEILRSMAVRMAYVTDMPEVDDMRNQIGIPGLLGLMSTHEVWTATVTIEEIESPTGHLSERPDSEEARVITCIDAWDRGHTLMRRRGHKPVVTMDSALRGDISTSLRIFVDMFYGRSPTEESFAEHYPTLATQARKMVDLSDPDMPTDPFVSHLRR